MAPMSYKQAATAPKGPPVTPKTGTGSKTKPVDILSPASQPSLAKSASEAAAKADETAKSGELMLSARMSEVNGLASLAAMGANLPAVVQTVNLMLVPLEVSLRMTEVDSLLACEKKTDLAYENVCALIDIRARVDDVPGSDTCLPHGRAGFKGIFDRDQLNKHNGVLSAVIAEGNSDWVTETIEASYAVTRMDTKFGPDHEGLALERPWHVSLRRRRVHAAAWPDAVLEFERGGCLPHVLRQ